MARPIRETPILYGKDAVRFETLIKEDRKASAEEKARIKASYDTFIQMMARGNSIQFPTKAI